jgi:hypothetical protein
MMGQTRVADHNELKAGAAGPMSAPLVRPASLDEKHLSTKSTGFTVVFTVIRILE